MPTALQAGILVFPILGATEADSSAGGRMKDKPYIVGEDLMTEQAQLESESKRAAEVSTCNYFENSEDSQ